MKLTWKQENQKALEQNFKKACEKEAFVKLVNHLKLAKQDAYRLTSKLEHTVEELEHCQKCKGFSQCKNSYLGHVSMPKKANNKVYFTYTPCRYKKRMEEEKLEKEQRSHQNELARMKDIDVTDKKRIKVIKWLDQFFEHYDYKSSLKGLYLHGNFGSGKTFFISALFHELEEKKNVTTQIIYYPEILRTLKNDWDLYEMKINLYETVDLLCIDDIGAEKVSDWSRDEVLGTILQTRMNQNKTTFFTSNLTLEELESHFKMNATIEEALKSRRIMERIKQLSTPMELVSENRRS